MNLVKKTGNPVRFPAVRNATLIFLLAMLGTAAEPSAAATRDSSALIVQGQPATREPQTGTRDQPAASVADKGAVAAGKVGPAHSGQSASGAAGVITVLSLAFVGLVVIARRNFGKPLERSVDTTAVKENSEAHKESSVARQTKRITE